MDENKVTKKSRGRYAPTNDNFKYNNNNDIDEKKAMDDADPGSKAPRRTAQDIM